MNLVRRDHEVLLAPVMALALAGLCLVGASKPAYAFGLTGCAGPAPEKTLNDLKQNATIQVTTDSDTTPRPGAKVDKGAGFPATSVVQGEDGNYLGTYECYISQLDGGCTAPKIEIYFIKLSTGDELKVGGGGATQGSNSIGVSFSRGALINKFGGGTKVSDVVMRTYLIWDGDQRSPISTFTLQQLGLY
jgi:hypothetical protein